MRILKLKERQLVNPQYRRINAGYNSESNYFYADLKYFGDYALMSDAYFKIHEFIVNDEKRNRILWKVKADSIKVKHRLTTTSRKYVYNYDGKPMLENSIIKFSDVVKFYDSNHIIETINGFNIYFNANSNDCEHIRIVELYIPFIDIEPNGLVLNDKRLVVDIDEITSPVKLTELTYDKCRKTDGVEQPSITIDLNWFETTIDEMIIG